MRELRADCSFVPYVWEIDKDGKSFSTVTQNVWRDKFDKWLLDQSTAPVS